MGPEAHHCNTTELRGHGSPSDASSGVANVNLNVDGDLDGLDAGREREEGRQRGGGDKKNGEEPQD